MWLSPLAFFSLLVLLERTAQAFGPFAPVKAKAKAAKQTTPTQVDTALELYQKKYPKSDKPRKRAFNAGFGMPARDLDGTKLKVAKDNEMGQAFSDIPQAELRATYTALANFFGDEAALQMVKDFTLILTINRNNLKTVMQAYGETFGNEEAIAMVRRNPGLLFCKPNNAAEADDLTMQF